mgnify:CR=1 FL=1|tara:strand:+ start:292 stop:507 length:216 start_codon:yes stop_codon:yes gene_type:complete
MFKTLINELKRYNDLKEKELDLKILGPFDYQEKWGVYPIQPVTSMVPQIVVQQPTEHVSSSCKNPWVSGYF